MLESGSQQQESGVSLRVEKVELEPDPNTYHGKETVGPPGVPIFVLTGEPAFQYLPYKGLCWQH